MKILCSNLEVMFLKIFSDMVKWPKNKINMKYFSSAIIFWAKGIYLIWLCFCVLETEPRVSGMLGKYSTTEPHPQLLTWI